jgi:hypothetical protein
MLLIIGAAAACTGMQSDSWWQLRSGQWIVATGQVGLVDPFSSTARGAPWPNHEWLAQVLCYMVYVAAGLRGVVLLCAAIAAATWWAIYRLCDGLPRYRVILLLAAVICHEIMWAVRPHMITLLFLALELLLLRRRRHWLLPPLFLLWANLHGGVAVGGIVLLVAVPADLIQRRALRPWLGLVAACAAATLVNPMGFGLWRFAISMFDHPETRYIQEWVPPSLGWPVSYPFFILVVVWLGAVAVRWRRLRGFDDILLVALGLVLLLLGFRAIRHTALFAVIALPLISQMLPTSSTGPQMVTARRGVVHAALGTLAAVACLALIAKVWNDPQRMVWEPLTPGAAAAVRSCPGPLYNTYNEGGAILWFVPERPVFVDSRNDPYSVDLLFRAVIAEQSGAYKALFDEYGVSCALVSIEKPIYTALRQGAGWRELYRDAGIAVLQRIAPERLPEKGSVSEVGCFVSVPMTRAHC